ncbi:MAG: carbohydrate-binding family 9-like protein [Proteobacteria bacterium]|nr:carbohydrate-binding family 9-like protein [Pseudomonadota bacterium]
MLTRSAFYALQPMPHWHNPPALPRAVVRCTATYDRFTFDFDVTEPLSCFRLQCQRDGDACWQDSCVEVFLQSSTGDYVNFECNAAGVCLAQVGPDRHQRRPFLVGDYALIHRQARILSHGPDAVCWTLTLSIPRTLLGLPPSAPLLGNLYKCASLAQTPHYLVAFPIHTPTPDFHQPADFQIIVPGA